MRTTSNSEILEGTFGRMRAVDDLLPPPGQLIFKNQRKKVTITLDQDSIDFFKSEAARLKVPYQRMIRNLLTEYVNQQRRQVA
jgi:uncharacterized protein (DUF4415 family)